MRSDAPHFRTAVSRQPRVIAAVWFAAFAFLASALMYLAPSLQRGLPAVLLYLGCPTISGLIAGSLLGHKVFTAPTSLRAAMVGAGVVGLSFVVFAPLYAVAYGLISDGQERPVALVLSILTIGVLMTGPLAFPIGALAGFVLFRLVHRPVKEPHALDH